MAIEIITTEYEEVHKAKPRGSHRWVFQATGATTGKGRPPRLHWTYETDGPFSEAKERALELARKAFGVTADVAVQVKPW